MAYIIVNKEQKGANRAFVLDKLNLVKLYDIGKEWVEHNKQEEEKVLIHCIAHLKNSSDTIVSDSLAPILDWSNNKKQELTVILIVMEVGEDCEYRIRIQRDPYFPTLLCKIKGKNNQEVQRVYDDVTSEFTEMNQWYSFLSNRCTIGQWDIVIKWLFRLFFFICSYNVCGFLIWTVQRQIFRNR